MFTPFIITEILNLSQGQLSKREKNFDKEYKKDKIVFLDQTIMEQTWKGL